MPWRLVPETKLLTKYLFREAMNRRKKNPCRCRQGPYSKQPGITKYSCAP